MFLPLILWTVLSARITFSLISNAQQSKKYFLAQYISNSKDRFSLKAAHPYTTIPFDELLTNVYDRKAVKISNRFFPLKNRYSRFL